MPVRVTGGQESFGLLINKFDLIDRKVPILRFFCCSWLTTFPKIRLSSVCGFKFLCWTDNKVRDRMVGSGSIAGCDSTWLELVPNILSTSFTVLVISSSLSPSISSLETFCFAPVRRFFLFLRFFFASFRLTEAERFSISVVSLSSSRSDTDSLKKGILINVCNKLNVSKNRKMFLIDDAIALAAIFNQGITVWQSKSHCHPLQADTEWNFSEFLYFLSHQFKVVRCLTRSRLWFLRVVGLMEQVRRLQFLNVSQRHAENSLFNLTFATNLRNQVGWELLRIIYALNAAQLNALDLRLCWIV